jgi:hypothetical protein
MLPTETRGSSLIVYEVPFRYIKAAGIPFVNARAWGCCPQIGLRPGEIPRESAVSVITRPARMDSGTPIATLECGSLD